MHLTNYHTNASESCPAKVGTGAPEVEITPEMIEAGARALMRDDPTTFRELSLSWAECYAEDVLRAALSIAPGMTCTSAVKPRPVL